MEHDFKTLVLTCSSSRNNDGGKGSCQPEVRKPAPFVPGRWQYNRIFSAPSEGEDFPSEKWGSRPLRRAYGIIFISRDRFLWQVPPLQLLFDRHNQHPQEKITWNRAPAKFQWVEVARLINNFLLRSIVASSIYCTPRPPRNSGADPEGLV